MLQLSTRHAMGGGGSGHPSLLTSFPSFSFGGSFGGFGLPTPSGEYAAPSMSFYHVPRPPDAPDMHRAVCAPG